MFYGPDGVVRFQGVKEEDEDGGGGKNQGGGYQSWNYYHDDFGLYDDDPEIVTLDYHDFRRSVSHVCTRMYLNNVFSCVLFLRLCTVTITGSSTSTARSAATATSWRQPGAGWRGRSRVSSELVRSIAKTIGNCVSSRTLGEEEMLELAIASF